MDKNVAVKQARLWQREARAIGQRGMVFSPSMLEAMAKHLDGVDGFHEAVGISQKATTTLERLGQIIDMLDPDAKNRVDTGEIEF